MRELEIKLERLLTEQNIAGFSVAVTDRERVIWSRGFGCESVERPHIAPDARTLYRIASITKVVTGLTVMRLVDAGKLELDRPVREYYPFLELSDERATARLTLRHLLSHTSGLPKEYTPDGAREEYTLEPSLRGALPHLALHSLPGEGKYLYSNWGIRLASLICEKVTDKPYSQLARELVIEPLGMTRTTFDSRVAMTYPLSLPHEEQADGKLGVLHYMKENAARLAAGGLYSSAEDLCCLARLLLNGGKTDDGVALITPESFAQMSRAHATREGNDTYGLTLMHYNSPVGPLLGHLGNADPYATSLFVDRQSGLGVVTLLNTFRAELRNEIPVTVLKELSKTR